MKNLTMNEIKSISGGDCKTATSWGRAVGKFFRDFNKAVSGAPVR